MNTNQKHVFEAYRQCVNGYLLFYDRQIRYWALNTKHPYFFIKISTENGLVEFSIDRWGYTKRPKNTPLKKWYPIDCRGDWKYNLKEVLWKIVTDWGSINFDIETSKVNVETTKYNFSPVTTYQMGLFR